MRFFPWFTEHYYSPLLPHELLQQLRSDVELTQSIGLWKSKTGGNFKGYFRPDGFSIQPLATVMRTPPLVLVGRVSPTISGSQLQLRYRLGWDTLVFWLLWEGMTGMLLVLLLVRHSGDLLIPFMFFAAGFGFTLLPFWLEATHSRPLLVKLLQLEPLLAS